MKNSYMLSNLSEWLPLDIAIINFTNLVHTQKESNLCHVDIVVESYIDSMRYIIVIFMCISLVI